MGNNKQQYIIKYYNLETARKNTNLIAVNVENKSKLMYNAIVHHNNNMYVSNIYVRNAYWQKGYNVKWP